MARRFAAGSAVLLACALSALVVNVDSAAAYNGSSPFPTQAQVDAAIMDQGNWTKIQSALNADTAAMRARELQVAGKLAGDGYTVADDYWRLRQLQPLPKIAPPVTKVSLINRLGSIGLGVTAFGFGWQLGRAIDTKWLHWSGEGLGYTPGFPVEAPQLMRKCAGASSYAFGGFSCSIADAEGTGIYILRTTSYDYTCDPAQSGCTTARPAWVWDTFQDVRTAAAYSFTQLTDGSKIPPYLAYAWYVPQATVAAQFHIDSALEPYGAQAWTLQDTDTGTADLNCAADSACANDVRDAIVQSPPKTRVAIIYEIYPELEPGYIDDPGVDLETEGQPATLTMPEVAYGETYSDYIARLRALGWVGTVTGVHPVPEDMYLPSLGPTAIRAIAPSPVRTIPTEEPIEFWINADPSTCGAPCTTGGKTPIPPAPPTAPPPGGSGINLGPITGINACDKFPIGVFCWAGSVLASFNVAPDAPRFDFANAAYWGDAHYVVDLEILDPYVAIIRGLITFCMWVGAIWYVGTRLLGYNASGDPGEAVDEAI